MVLLRESARASAARKAFRAGKNRALPTIPLCRPKRPPIQPLRFRWISSPLCRCLFLRAFLSLWLKHQVFPLLLASLRLPSKRSPAGPFCIALSCPAGMPAASHRACAALVEPFLRPSQNRSECKFRMYEPYFESATQCTSSQDSASSTNAAEYFRPLKRFLCREGFSPYDGSTVWENNGSASKYCTVVPRNTLLGCRCAPLRTTRRSRLVCLLRRL